MYLFDWKKIGIYNNMQIEIILPSVVLGIMLFFSFAVAPIIFKVLKENDARKFVRTIFPYYYCINLILVSLKWNGIKNFVHLVNEIMISKTKKILIIGGGILGLSIARKFLLEGYKNIIILEKEKYIACHQSSRNSGVMHAGLYYEPKSLKAQLSRKGIVLMKEFCKHLLCYWSLSMEKLVPTQTQI